MAIKNYTTKTAALKATTADIRKLNATSVDADKIAAGSITVGEGEEAVDILEAIDTAADTAVKAAGIQVGTESSKVTADNLGVDADGDGILDAGLGQKIKGMNFCGNVAVVNNADGTVDFWFMNPNNEAGAETATETAAGSTSVYVYDGNGDTNGINDGGTNAKARLQTATGADTYTISGDSGTTMSAPNKVTKIKVVVEDGAGTKIEEVTSPAICEANTATKVRGGTITTKSENQGIQITVSNVIDNIVNETYNDAQDGKTPGYVRYSANVKTYTNKLVPNGGTYKVKIYTVAGDAETLIKTGSLMYAYASNALTAEDAPSATYTYNATGTNTISGLTYDSAATVTLNVTGIKGTQRGGAHTKAQNARARVTTKATGNGGFEIAVQDITTELESGNQYDETAVFKGSVSDSLANTSDPVQVRVSAVGEVKTYEQGGTASSVAKCTPVSEVTPATWLYTQSASAQDTEWTSNTAGIAINFTSDGSRVLADYGTLLANGHTTYDKTKGLLEDGYTSQLLVQGGGLRHPKQDKTTTYKDATGWRSYVVPVTFKTTGVTALTITATGLSSFDNTKLRMYLVGRKSDGTGNAQCLTWSQSDSAACVTATGAIGVATGTPNSSNAWTVAMDPSAVTGFPLNNTSGYTYYLVVEMADTCTTKITGITIK